MQTAHCNQDHFSTKKFSPYISTASVAVQHRLLSYCADGKIKELKEFSGNESVATKHKTEDKNNPGVIDKGHFLVFGEVAVSCNHACPTA